jgi:hypothetical protein
MNLYLRVFTWKWMKLLLVLLPRVDVDLLQGLMLMLMLISNYWSLCSTEGRRTTESLNPTSNPGLGETLYTTGIAPSLILTVYR